MDGELFIGVLNRKLYRIIQAPELFQPEDDNDDNDDNDSQEEDKPVGTRTMQTDIYALGMVSFYMLIPLYPLIL